MELTIDDCLAIAWRECATEHELRAAVCVAVGQALHYRYEARGYSDAAEVAKRDADRARAEARAYSEALIAKDSAPDTSDGIDYPARAEVWKLREAVRERESFSLRLSAAERERDEARAERDALRDRPAYEARTVAPTRTEQERHKATRGRWLVTWQERHAPALRSDVVAGVWPPRTYPDDAVYIPLDAYGLPCAWPVVP